MGSYTLEINTEASAVDSEFWGQHLNLTSPRRRALLAAQYVPFWYTLLLTVDSAEAYRPINDDDDPEDDFDGTWYRDDPKHHLYVQYESDSVVRALR